MATQDDLFGGPPLATPAAPAPAVERRGPVQKQPADTPPHGPRKGGVQPVLVDPAQRELAAALPPGLRLGTSSWSYPGWQGLVWAGEHSAATLARQGLAVLAQHPLMRAVSIDRGFYRPLTVSEYERYASQVPADFRFVVKAPSLVTDALVRSEDGRGREPNPAFLDPALTVSSFVEPALKGLGSRLGALVLQISPLPLALLDRLPALVARLHALLRALPPLAAPGTVVAVEVRDPEWLATPGFAEALRSAGATYCLGLHPKLPPLADQLPVLRALWPGPLVCRWNLNPVHGPYGYEAAETLYAPYDQLHHPDLQTRAELAQLIATFTSRGQSALVTISNHAEGSAPRTVQALAEAVRTACAARAQAAV